MLLAVFFFLVTRNCTSWLLLPAGDMFPYEHYISFQGTQIEPTPVASKLRGKKGRLARQGSWRRLGPSRPFFYMYICDM